VKGSNPVYLLQAVAPTFPNVQEIVQKWSIGQCGQLLQPLISCFCNNLRLAVGLLRLAQDMVRIQKSQNGDVVFSVSGQMDEEAVAELEKLLSSETKGRPLVFDLKDVTLVNENAIAFFVSCEASGITLNNCPRYIREWINALRRERQ
jgi:hypothetical protein